MERHDLVRAVNSARAALQNARTREETSELMAFFQDARQELADWDSTHRFCIVTEDDRVLEKGLDERTAEQRLTWHLNGGEDAFLGEYAEANIAAGVWKDETV